MYVATGESGPGLGLVLGLGNIYRGKRKGEAEGGRGKGEEGKGLFLL